MVRLYHRIDYDMNEARRKKAGKYHPGETPVHEAGLLRTENMYSKLK